MTDIPSKINTWQMVSGPVFDQETRKITAPGNTTQDGSSDARIGT